MKKLSTYLLLIIFSFSTFSFAEDISEYQIGGISIGESLLKYLSKEEIISEIEINKSTYNYLNNDFGEVYLFKNIDNYYALTFMVKPKDKYFNIYSVRGLIAYDDIEDFGTLLDKCFEEVQNSNMSKLDVAGKPIYNDVGKVMKGPNYFKPDLSKFIK